MDENVAAANAALVSGGVPASEDNEEQAEEQAAAETVTLHCRWCGQPHAAEAEDEEDFLCDNCERYQDAMTCPTCKQIARVSLMPHDMVPEAHAPGRRRKAKEG